MLSPSNVSSILQNDIKMFDQRHTVFTIAIIPLQRIQNEKCSKNYKPLLHQTKYFAFPSLWIK